MQNALDCFGRRQLSVLVFAAAFVSAFLLNIGVAGGVGPRVLAEGKLPDDVRLKPLKDLNGYFPFKPPVSTEEWAARADFVRRRILVAEGLWPMPTKTPLNAVRHGRIDTPEYSVERVF